MTQEQAIYNFLNRFGIPAYAASSVPDQDSPDWKGFPYITYELVLGVWERGEVNMTVNIWDKTTSEARINAKVREIGDVIGLGGVQLPCDGGTLWLKKGSPWAQAMSIEGEEINIKRRYLNISVETNAI